MSVCRRESRSYTLANVCERLSIQRAAVGRALRRIRRSDSTPGPTRFVRRAISLLGGTIKQEQTALKIVELLDRHHFVDGRCPIGIALASALLAFTDDRAVTAKLQDACKTMGCCRRTVLKRRNEAKEILRRVCKVLPSDPTRSASKQWQTDFVLEYIEVSLLLALHPSPSER